MTNIHESLKTGEHVSQRNTAGMRVATCVHACILSVDIVSRLVESVLEKEAASSHCQDLPTSKGPKCGNSDYLTEAECAKLHISAWVL